MGNSNNVGDCQVNNQELNQKQLGVPHVQNPYWKMARQGLTRSLSNAFKEAEIDCYTDIVQLSGHTLVHQAITLNRRELFKLCQVYGANWNKSDHNGVTPLMKAAALNRQYFFQRLIQLGADVHLKDHRGRTAKDYATLYQNFEFLDLLKQQ